MKTNIRDTSLMAYQTARITEGQRKVLDFMLKHPRVDFTRNELAQLSGLPIQSVCGRVNELIAVGLLEERVRRGCRFSGKQAHPLRLTPRQLTLDVAA